MSVDTAVALLSSVDISAWVNSLSYGELAVGMVATVYFLALFLATRC
jgi:hypothetical protein